jgi:hypothetical protein
MLLIRELIEQVEYLEESDKNGSKSMYVYGPTMQSEIQNKNGRIYPRAVMEGALNKYLDTKFKNKTAYGELSHPQGPKINEDRIAHLFTELNWQGNDVVGKAKILNTPMGNIAKGIMEGGGRLGISSRGLGTLKQNSKGIMEVQNDFTIATPGDLVTDPSAPSAWMSSVMENVSWSLDPNTGEYFKEMIEETKKEIKKSSLTESEKLRIFRTFVNSI